jgi:hypothetical protein
MINRGKNNATQSADRNGKQTRLDEWLAPTPSAIRQMAQKFGAKSMNDR